MLHCVLHGLQGVLEGFQGVSRCVSVCSGEGYLSEAFEMEDEDVWECPEAELDAPLLQLFTVRAAPGVVRGQLG